MKRSVAEQFLIDYYEKGNAVDRGATWKDTYWRGVPVRKLPMDLWLYQEILQELRPDIIIECGTAFGGSAYYLADLCNILAHGRVITIDIDEWNIEFPGYTGRPKHERISYILGSSVSPEVVETVHAHIPANSTVMVILDSDHRASHVQQELMLYAPLVTLGSILIVEDTMLNGHPVHPGFGDGPMEALEKFLRTNPEFEVDPIGNRFVVSFNPRGYLRRVR